MKLKIYGKGKALIEFEGTLEEFLSEPVQNVLIAADVLPRREPQPRPLVLASWWNAIRASLESL